MAQLILDTMTGAAAESLLPAHTHLPSVPASGAKRWLAAPGFTSSAAEIAANGAEEIGATVPSIIYNEAVTDSSYTVRTRIVLRAGTGVAGPIGFLNAATVGALNCYMALFNGTNIELSKFIGGVGTPLGTVAIPTGDPSDWGLNLFFDLTLDLTTAGTVKVSFQSVATGHFLQPGGTWAAGVANCISVADSSLTSGYTGFRNDGTTSVGVDEFEVVGNASLTPGILTVVATNIGTNAQTATAASGGTSPYQQKLQRSANGTTGWTDIGTLGAGLSWTDGGLTAAQNTYYRVFYQDAASNTATSAVIHYIAPSVAVITGVDSRTAGAGSSTPPGGGGTAAFPYGGGADYPSQLKTLLGVNFADINQGLNAQTFADAYAAFASQVSGVITAAIAAGGAAVYVGWGDNDLWLTSVGGASDVTACLTAQKNMAAAVKAAGGKYIAVGLPSRSASGSSNPTFTADDVSLDNQIRDGWRGWADGYVDLRGDDARLITDQLDETHYGDTANGFVAQNVAAAVRAAISGGVVPVGTVNVNKTSSVLKRNRN